MKTKNLIGLDSENAQQVVNLLNELLANYQIYYQNLRGFHWNVRGNRFFVLMLNLKSCTTMLSKR